MNKENLCEVALRVVREITFKRMLIISIQLLPLLMSFSSEVLATAINLDLIGDATVVPATKSAFKYAPYIIGILAIVAFIYVPGQFMIKLGWGLGIIIGGNVLLVAAQKGLTLTLT